MDFYAQQTKLSLSQVVCTPLSIPRRRKDLVACGIDFQADCGDGFHSSYAIAYLLAQPILDVVSDVPHRENVYRLPNRRKAMLVSRSTHDDVKMRMRSLSMQVEDLRVEDVRLVLICECGCQEPIVAHQSIRCGDIVEHTKTKAKYVVTWISHDSKSIRGRPFGVNAKMFTTIKSKVSELESTGLVRLRRGRVLIIGGDLAYPTPSIDNYTKRFVRVFEQALPPPARRTMFSVNKNAFHTSKHTCGPIAYLVPGNHDYFDGLHCFLKYVVNSDWLGGTYRVQSLSLSLFLFTD